MPGYALCPGREVRELRADLVTATGVTGLRLALEGRTTK